MTMQKGLNTGCVKKQTFFSEQIRLGQNQTIKVKKSIRKHNTDTLSPAFAKMYQTKGCVCAKLKKATSFVVQKLFTSNKSKGFEYRR